MVKPLNCLFRSDTKEEDVPDRIIELRLVKGGPRDQAQQRRQRISEGAGKNRWERRFGISRAWILGGP